MPGLGSITEGMVGTQLDLQNIQMNNVKLQDAQIGLMKDKIDLNKQITMLGLMQNMQLKQSGQTNAGTPPTRSADDLSSWLNDMAGIQLQSGMVDDAAKTANIASRLQENASKIDYRTFKMQNDRLSKFANVLSTVQDSPEGYQQAIGMMMAEDPGVVRDQKFQALQKMQWRPGLINSLRTQVMSEKDRQEISYRKAAADHAEASTTLDQARVNLVKAQTRVAEDRDKNLRKVGAIPVKAEQLRAITDQALRDFPAADPADIRVRSRPLAEQMVKMVRDEHLTESQAATRVYEQARTNGTFSGLRVAPTMPGTKPGVAMPLPKDKSGKVAAGQIKDNQWYLVRGQPMMAMEGKFYTEQELSEMDDKDASVDDNSNSDEDTEEAQ